MPLGRAMSVMAFMSHSSMPMMLQLLHRSGRKLCCSQQDTMDIVLSLRGAAVYL